MNRWNTQHDYYAEVESDAASAVKETGKWGMSADVSDHLHEMADSMVIYTATAHSIMRHSREHNAAYDQGMMEGKTFESSGESATYSAYFAYYQDLATAFYAIDEEDALVILEMFKCPNCSDIFNNEEGGMMEAHYRPETVCHGCQEDLLEEDEAIRAADESDQG
jgi:hypothetical protein